MAILVPDDKCSVNIGAEFDQLEVFGHPIYLRVPFLHVKSKNKKSRKEQYCICRCKCGNFVLVRVYSLLSKTKPTRSCGCLSYKKLNQLNTKHGLWQHPIYFIWIRIKTRCYNKQYEEYEYYGARGISMCDEWRNDFVKFYEWSIANGWESGLTIDRINNDGNYEPENCRYVDLIVQNNNKRDNVIVNYKGVDITIGQLARHDDCVVDYNTLWRRIVRLKWEIEDAVNKPKGIPTYSYNGKDFDLKQWSEEPESVVSYRVLRYRVNDWGWDFVRALTTPSKRQRKIQ